MKNMREFKGKKYIIMMLLSITLSCITVFANDRAMNQSTTSSQITMEQETTELLEEIAELRREVTSMKQELNNINETYGKTYIAQKDVNVFLEQSSNSKLMGVFKAGSVIKANNISEDGIWIETDQGYVKEMFVVALEDVQQHTTFQIAKEEVKQETVKPKEYKTGVTGKSGLTKEDLDYLLAGSRMADCSDEVLKIEKENNVNAFFTISVAQAETQRGKTGTGKSKNNAYGITSTSGGYRTFGSLADSVIEFGGMMERMYISKGRNTVAKVHAIYTDSPNWAGNVNTIMNKELAKIKGK